MAGMFYEPVWEYAGYKLVKRPDTPYYHIAWRKPGSRRLRRRTTRLRDLGEAKRWLIRFADARRPGARATPDEVGIVETLSWYLPTLEGRAGLIAARTALKHWTAFSEAEDLRTVADLTPPMQRAFIEWRRSTLIAQGHAASNGTLIRDIGVLRAALKFSWKTGRLSEVPPIATVPQPPPRDRFLTEAECRRLIDACSEPHLRLFVTMALHTLQRPAAIFELTADRVDLGRGVIDFNRPGRPLTRKGRAVVPVTRTLRPLVEDAVAHSLSGHIVEWDGKPVKSVKRSFATARARAGLGREVSPYTLRHTGATLLAAAGVPMRQIAGMLGHSDTRTTERHYAKHSPDFMQEAVTALDEIFADGPELGSPPALFRARSL